MITNIRKKIFDLGSTVTGLTGFFFTEVPSNQTKPYGVFNQISNPNDLDTGSISETIYLQVDIFGNNLTTLEVIEERVKAKFDNAERSLDNNTYHCDRIDRQNTRIVKDDKVWQITITYKIEFTKN